MCRLGFFGSGLWSCLLGRRRLFPQLNLNARDPCRLDFDLASLGLVALQFDRDAGHTSRDKEKAFRGAQRFAVENDHGPGRNGAHVEPGGRNWCGFQRRGRQAQEYQRKRNRNHSVPFLPILGVIIMDWPIEENEPPRSFPFMYAPRGRDLT